MGLKTTNYTISAIGIMLENAYAKVGNIDIDKMGNAKAVIEIQQTRENVELLEPLETHEVNFIADKTLPIYEQAYTAAKTILTDWQDDIVAEASV